MTLWTVNKTHIIFIESNLSSENNNSLENPNIFNRANLQSRTWTMVIWFSNKHMRNMEKDTNMRYFQMDITNTNFQLFSYFSPPYLIPYRRPRNLPSIHTYPAEQKEIIWYIPTLSWLAVEEPLLRLWRVGKDTPGCTPLCDSHTHNHYWLHA